MRFIEAFIEELTKEAGARGGLLRRIGESLPTAGSLAAIGGAGALVGHAFGKRKGER